MLYFTGVLLLDRTATSTYDRVASALTSSIKMAPYLVVLNAYRDDLGVVGKLRVTAFLRFVVSGDVHHAEIRTDFVKVFSGGVVAK